MARQHDDGQAAYEGCFVMAGCYECNYCGKCTHGGFSVEAPSFVCADCGHVAKPGEDIARCADCGGNRMELVTIQSKLDN